MFWQHCKTLITFHAGVWKVKNHFEEDLFNMDSDLK